MINFGLDNFFEESDPRYKVYEILKKLEKGPLNEEEANVAAKAYFEMRDLCFEKFKALADSKNPYAMIASIHLTTELTRTGAESTIQDQLRLWEDFNDVMLSIVLLRTMEDFGKIDKPFKIKIEDKEIRKDD